MTRASIWSLWLSPIAVLPGLHDRWGWPKLLVALAAALIAMGLPAAGRFPRWFSVSVLAVCAVLTTTALFGKEPLAQLLGRAPRYEGAIVLVVLIAVGAAGARLLGPDATVIHRRHAVRAAATASVLLAGVAVLESTGLRPIESDLIRPGSLTGNATDQGILGAIFVAVLGSALVGENGRNARLDVWAAVGTAAGLVSVATSNSRAAVLGLGVVAIGLVLRFLRSSLNRRRDTMIAACVVLAASVTVIAVPLTRDRLFGVSGFAQQTIADRLFMWDDAWQLFLSDPWSGAGMNGFADAVTPFFGDEWFGRAQVGAILDSPHNVALQAAVTGGVPGVLVAFTTVFGALWLGISHARRASGERRDLLIGGLFAIVAAGLALLTHVSSATTLIPLAALVGVVVAVAPADRVASTHQASRSTKTARTVPAPARRVADSAAMIGCGAWLVLLIVCTVADAALFSAQRALMRGDLSASLVAFDRAQSLRPWDPDVSLVAVSALGAAVQNGLAGAVDPAEDWAERALDALPSSSRANYLAGMVAVERVDESAAVERLGRAAELSPADPRIQHEFGVALLVAGDPDAARAPLERAVALAPASAVSWRALHDVCVAVGDEECALRAAEGEHAASH